MENSITILLEIESNHFAPFSLISRLSLLTFECPQVIIGHLYSADKLVIENKKTLKPSDD